MINFKKKRHISIILLMVIIAQLILPVDLIIAEEQGETIEKVEQSQEEIEKDIEDKTEEDQIDLGENVSRKDVGGQEVVELGDEEVEEDEIVDTTQVLSGEVSGGRDLSTEIKFFNPILKKNQTEIENVIELDKDTLLEYSIEWEVANGVKLKDGDFAEFNSGEITKYFSDDKQNLSGEMKDKEGVTVGSYSFNKEENKLRITFNSELENKESRNGGVTAFVKFSSSEFEESTIKEIALSEDEEKTYTFLYDTGIYENIDKVGEASGNEIIWTIDINKSLEDLKNVVLEETIPDGLEFVEGSLSIKQLKIAIVDDKVSITEGIDSFTDKNSFDNNRMELGNIGRKAYRLRFRTKRVDFDKNSFINTVKLTHSLGEKSAEDRVDLTSANKLEKRALKKGLNEIIWSVNITKMTKTMNLEDVFYSERLDGNKLTLIKDSLVLKNSSEKEISIRDKIELKEDGSGFNLKLDEEHMGDFTLEYKTKIDYGNELKGAYSFINQIEDIENPSVNSWDRAEYNILDKTASNPVGEEGFSYITWEVVVNSSKESLGNIILVDVLPEGVEIDEASLKLDGKTLEESKYTIEGNKLQINLDNVSTDYKLTYRTKIVDLNKDEYTNKVSFDLNGESINRESSVDGKMLEAQVWKYGNLDYSTGITKWQIRLIDHKGSIDSLVLEDSFEGTLPMDFVEGSLKVNGIEYKDYFDFVSEKGFTLTLNDKGKERLKDNYNNLLIEYQTKTDLDKTENKDSHKLINKVNVTIREKDQDEKTLDADATITLDPNFSQNGYKEGFLSEEDKRYIDWKAYLNLKSKNLGTTEIVDTLDGNQIFIEDSIKIYEIEVDEKGKPKLDNRKDITSKFSKELVKDKDKETLKLKIKGNYTISKPLMLEYRTKRTGESVKTYKNTIKLDGEYIGEVDHDFGDRYIYKALGDNSQQVFKGSVLDWNIVVNEKYSELKSFKVTDEISDNLYFVKDSVIVDGDKLSDDKISMDGNKITFDLGYTDKPKTISYKTVVLGNGDNISNTAYANGQGISIEESSKVVVEKEIIQGSSGFGTGVSPKPEIGLGVLNIKKIDSENNKLNDAKFKLEKIEGKKRLLISDEITLGEISIELPFGEYELTEIEAPEGYIVSKDVEKITLSREENQIDLEVKNYAKGSKRVIHIEKRWLDDNEKNIDEKLLPESIIVNLFANGEKIEEIIISKKDNWKVSIEDLDVEENGEEILYKIEEVRVEGYETGITGDMRDGFIVTNKKSQDKTPEDPGKPIDPWDPKEEPKDPEGEIPVDPVKPVDPSEEDETVIDDGKIDKEKPTDPDKKNPVDVDDTTGIKSGDIDKDSDKEDNSQIEGKNINRENNKDQLPKTGNVNSYLLVFLGLLIAGFGINLIKREKLGK